MSYIGNPIVSTDFPKDTFSGNGSTTAFTMSIAPASVNAIMVVVSGITQDPSTYTINGTTLTFSAAPPTGTDNISVRHLGIAGTPNVPALGSVVPASINSSYSLWNLSGSDVNYTAGKVGVGSASPRVKLDVRSDAVIAAPTPLANAVASGVLAVGDSVGSVVGLQLNGSSYDTYIQARNMGAASTPYNLLLQPLGGNVGIGGAPAISTYAGAHIQATYPTVKLTSTSTGHTATDGFEFRIDSTPRGEIWMRENAPIAFGTNDTERMQITAGGDLKFNSGYGSVATAYGCRAWVNFNGTGTVAIRASGNVSSITDNGTGDYTVNFTTAMPDANYNIVSMGQRSDFNNGDMNISLYGNVYGSAITTSSVRVNSAHASSYNISDALTVCISVFR